MSAQTQFIITTIKPVASSLYASFKPRSKEGMPEKQEVFVSYELPSLLTQIANEELKAFAIRAYGSAIENGLKQAVRDGKESFSLSMGEMYAATKREFLITRKDLGDWLDGFAMPIIYAAIASKASLHIDSPKVVKKGNLYKAIMEKLASRTLMNQEEIDAAIKVMGLLEASGKSHAYSDNVAEGIARKQEKLNAALAGISDDDLEDVDF